MSSILNDVKKAIGPSAEYEIFEPEIIMHINTVLFKLNRLGVGPDDPFVIEDDGAEWSDFVTGVAAEACKTYICLQTRMYFDPPTSGTLINAINEQLKELEWRLNESVDPKED